MKKPQSTLKPRTIFCYDNLPILRGINSDSIDLVYLDPPFNKGRNFHAPIGTMAAGASFEDIWNPDKVKDEWHNEINDRSPRLYKYLDAVGAVGSRSAKYYLIYMAVRLLEIHRVLKPAGGVYLHCDPTASHYLKLLMDTVFGHQNFKNEIAWCYRSPARAANQFPRKHDIILFYGKSRENLFNADAMRVPHSRQNLSAGATGMAGGDRTFAEIRRNESENLLRGKVVEDWWSDIGGGGHIPKVERTGYRTQKPLALLERIIRASSNEGDLVLDPFCGCATTCIAAERLGRNWVGVDISAKAFELVQMRLKKEVPPDLFRGKPIFRQDIPARTDLKKRGEKLTKEEKYFLFGGQNGKCAGCKTNFDIQHFEGDHIIPQSQGGAHDLENRQLLCANCNRLKGDRPMEYLKARIAALYRAD